LRFRVGVFHLVDLIVERLIDHAAGASTSVKDRSAAHKTREKARKEIRKAKTNEDGEMSLLVSIKQFYLNKKILTNINFRNRRTAAIFFSFQQQKKSASDQDGQDGRGRRQDDTLPA